eukprot:360133-Chlamydomonas_euryale.AAC.4
MATSASLHKELQGAVKAQPPLCRWRACSHVLASLFALAVSFNPFRLLWPFPVLVALSFPNPFSTACSPCSGYDQDDPVCFIWLTEAELLVL